MRLSPKRELALGDFAVAVTGISASLASGELETARQVAFEIGIRHEVLATQEFNDPNYVANPANRCYFCKTELYDQLEPLATKLGLAVIANGSEHRRCRRLSPRYGRRWRAPRASPLLECGFNKADVRQLAAEWQLTVSDKPASPCLSSRVAYGEEVTPQRLQMIDHAEQLLRSLRFGTVRVHYRGDLARLEVPLDAIAQLAAPETRQRLAAELKLLGFKYVTLDLEGFRSGSQNKAIAGQGNLPIIQ